MTRMRFGIFMAPFHPAGENPTLLLDDDLELIEHLDQLGFDEAWIGEHHSAGSEIDRVAGDLHRGRRAADQRTSSSAPAWSAPATTTRCGWRSGLCSSTT